MLWNFFPWRYQSVRCWSQWGKCMFRNCINMSTTWVENSFHDSFWQNSTPIIITGAPRLCNIDLRPNPECGNLYGLYGNSFARQSPDAVLAAVQVLDPPGLSNLIAMAAPPPGFGVYSLDVIRDILQTTITGERTFSFPFLFLCLFYFYFLFLICCLF